MTPLQQLKSKVEEWGNELGENDREYKTAYNLVIATIHELLPKEKDALTNPDLLKAQGLYTETQVQEMLQKARDDSFERGWKACEDKFNKKGNYL